MLLTIIVPCYNEEIAIPLFYQALTETMIEIHMKYELLFVNDGSNDNSLNIIKELAAKDERVTYISFTRNFGKEAAMYGGLCNSKGDYVAVMDVDLQDPPELLPQMISIMEDGEYDCVATKRTDRKGEPTIRSWFARLFYKYINRHSESDIVDGARDYRVMRREMVDAIIAMGERNRFSKGIFGWVGFNTCWISYQNVQRIAGKTKWSFLKLTHYALDGLFSFTDAPLSMASYIGTTMSGISFIALLFVIVRKLLFGDPVAGWASTICIIVFIGGVQLAVLGLIGEYIAKTYIETKNRPHYIIRDSNIEDIVKIK